MNKETFIKNRKNILSLMNNDSVLILFNRPLTEKNKRGKVDKNFYYSTGNGEKNNVLVLSKINNTTNEVMFIKKFDELVAKWEGAYLSKDEITNQTGINNVLYLDELDNMLEKILEKATNVYVDSFRNKLEGVLLYEQNFVNSLKEKKTLLNILDACDILKQSRMIKSEEEISTMRKAIAITKDGIESMLKNAKVGIHEYQVESYFDQIIKFNNATHAFTTIAASGKNACCLHYSDNNAVLKDGDLMLLDLGACFENYNADISRTFPVNGKFTNRQKELYNIVLDGQLEAIKFIKPGITLNDINNNLLDYYEVKLKEIGLIKKRDEITKYYYHRISHHIGLDTHDLSDYDTPLTENMVITCEPGLYIEEEKIGIRIEDDLLVTKDGCVNLSKDILKTVEEIENFMKNN